MTSTATPLTAKPSILRTGGLLTLVAAVVNTVVAAIAKGAGNDLTVAGTKLNVVQFGISTLFAGILGTGIAHLESRGKLPRRSFSIAATAGAVLSLVGPVTADATNSTRLLLAATHILAAAVIIPGVQRRVAQ